MSDNLFNQSENVYLSILVKEDEKILWNGHPGSMDIGIRKVLLPVGVLIILGAFVLSLIYAVLPIFYHLYEFEFDIIAIIGFSLAFLVGAILMVVGISANIHLEDPQTTEYYISSQKIIKLKYGQAKVTTPSLSMSFIPIVPALLNHHHHSHLHHYYYHKREYVPPKDVVLALNLDQIKQIIFDPSKKNDDRLMHITFYPKDQVIQSFEFVHGELVSKVSPDKKI